MVIKRGLLIVLFIGISACVASNECPPKEDLPHCRCSEEQGGSLNIKCVGYDTGKTIEDYKTLLQENNLRGKRNIKLTFDRFNKGSRLSSRLFDGFHIATLEFSFCNVSRWADEEGSPAFVGLEDSLEKLIIHNSIRKPISNNDYLHKDDKALMSLGHLRKLRTVQFKINKIPNFGNDWFSRGGSSVEVLKLEYCNTYFIGDSAFASFNNLKEISVKSNKVSKLSRSMFPNPANQMEIFMFWGNKLESLPDGFFSNMPLLKEVNLASNFMTRLPEAVWRPVWSQLEKLSFEQNELYCDSHINWVFTVKPPKKMLVICDGPPALQYMLLEDLIKMGQK